jgi:hypothetical protein
MRVPSIPTSKERPKMDGEARDSGGQEVFHSSQGVVMLPEADGFRLCFVDLKSITGHISPPIEEFGDRGK